MCFSPNLKKCSQMTFSSPSQQQIPNGSAGFCFLPQILTHIFGHLPVQLTTGHPSFEIRSGSVGSTTDLLPIRTTRALSLWLCWEENGRTAGCITERDLNSKYKYYLCFAFFAYIFISPRCSDADADSVIRRRRRRMLSLEMNRTLIWTSAVRYSETFLKYFNFFKSYFLICSLLMFW